MDPELPVELSRRRLVQAAAAIAVLGPLGLLGPSRAGATVVAPANVDPATRMAFEAFADTLIPGKKRSRRDPAIAGVAPGPSGAATGAVDILALPAVGLADVLPGLGQLLNGQAAEYAGHAGVPLDPTLPPFVALPYEHRARLVDVLADLTTAGGPAWILVATMIDWAFDMAATTHTDDALDAVHPGLTWIRFPAPRRNGIWRFRDHSYGRKLAHISPLTTKSGSPA